MFRKFYPYQYIHSVFCLNYEKLYSLGYRGIIFDIDNTLVHHGDDSTAEVDKLFRHIQSIGFKTLLLSNNNEERVKRFMKNIKSFYICNANKPEPENYLKAVEFLGMEKSRVLVIGDQLFTDIYGANRSGIVSILVDFIRLPNERKIGKKRRFEKVILIFYKRNQHYRNRLGKITKEEDQEQGCQRRKKYFFVI